MIGGHSTVANGSYDDLLDPEVKKMLEHTPSVGHIAGQRLTCRLTSHEFPANLAALRSHLSSARYLKAMQLHNLLVEHSDYIIDQGSNLYCELTNKIVAKQYTSLKCHVDGKRFRRALEQKASVRELNYHQKEEQSIDSDVKMDGEQTNAVNGNNSGTDEYEMDAEEACQSSENDFESTEDDGVEADCKREEEHIIDEELLKDFGYEMVDDCHDHHNSNIRNLKRQINTKPPKSTAKRKKQKVATYTTNVSSLAAQCDARTNFMHYNNRNRSSSSGFSDGFDCSVSSVTPDITHLSSRSGGSPHASVVRRENLQASGLPESVVGAMLEAKMSDALDKKTLRNLHSLLPTFAEALIYDFLDRGTMGVLETHLPSYFSCVVQCAVNRLNNPNCKSKMVPFPSKERIQSMVEKQDAKQSYSLVVTVGQRMFKRSDQNWDFTTGTECHVGRLPSYVFEYDLYDIMEQCGKIVDIRVLMDPSSFRNKGFAFVRFETPAEAKTFAEKFHNSTPFNGMTPRDELITVTVSESKSRLFIGGVPRELSRDAILRELGTFYPGITNVVVQSAAPSPDAPRFIQQNRGFCLVDFKNHLNASRCKRRLEEALANRAPCRPFAGLQLHVDWARASQIQDRSRYVPTERKIDITGLFVKHLHEEFTKDMLREVFAQFGKVVRSYRGNDYGIIYFENEEQALTAMTAMQQKDICGSGKPCQISYARVRDPGWQRRQTQANGPRTFVNAGYTTGFNADSGLDSQYGVRSPFPPNQSLVVQPVAIPNQSCLSTGLFQRQLSTDSAVLSENASFQAVYNSTEGVDTMSPHSPKGPPSLLSLSECPQYYPNEAIPPFIPYVTPSFQPVNGCQQLNGGQQPQSMFSYSQSFLPPFYEGVNQNNMISTGSMMQVQGVPFEHPTQMRFFQPNYASMQLPGHYIQPAVYPYATNVVANIQDVPEQPAPPNAGNANIYQTQMTAPVPFQPNVYDMTAMQSALTDANNNGVSRVAKETSL